MNERQKKILSILADVLECPADQLKPEQTLTGDLSIDSAQTLELLSAIEEEFDRDISEVEAAKVRTVQDILDFA